MIFHCMARPHFADPSSVDGHGFSPLLAIVNNAAMNILHTSVGY